MTTAFAAGTGTGFEDGLSGSKGCRASGFESGCQREWRGGADGVDERMSVL